MDLTPSNSTTTIISTDLAEQVGNYVREAKAPNTRKAYRSSWRRFTGWCLAHGLSALPAAPTTVAAYLATMSGTLKPSTLSLHVSAVGQAHQMAGFVSPTKSVEVRTTMQGIRRTHGTAPRQKAPLLVADLKAIVRRLGDTTAGLRDRALLLVGFAGGLRRSELVGLDVDDLDFHTEGLVLKLRRSKTDQLGRGRLVGVGHGTSEATCPVIAIRRWLQGGQLTTGPVFRPVDRHGHVRDTRLSTDAVARIIQVHGAEIGLDPKKLGGHSLRAGFVTAAAAVGISECEIGLTTGHRSVAILRRYVREATPFEGDAVRRLGL